MKNPKPLTIDVGIIKEFYTAFKQDAVVLKHRQHPQQLSEERFLLRQKLSLEELDELREANEQGNRIEQLDALADRLYLLLGDAYEFGLLDLLPEALAEVHRSNMSKLDAYGEPILREDGKILKGPNFFPPALWELFVLKRIEI